ncbi:metal ABC transporter solute-binding protein, Zn/Mn family [Gleimia hominis]|uniref:metal ABC transporter solute-binding protein, Zn/Mn family n=1 Tax=Gleimia hominis TaxID=595468 RepID=UPI000C8018F0|nr:zinc ABC transporter substrate-binding protein [Gleimia hominis]WIK64554.1 zinc ABC transporter substrate-binding protein [Gleimia hominis]
MRPARFRFRTRFRARHFGLRALLISLCAVLPLTAVGCDRHALKTDGRISAVTSTPIITDLARQVAGNRARVTGLMKPGSDPHTYEPSLRDIRNVANADVVFTNGLMLEEQALTRAIDANLQPGVQAIALAQAAQDQGARLIPLVEDAALDTVWLGLRTIGKPAGASGSSGDSGDAGTSENAAAARTVTMHLDRVEGPGQLFAYLTGTFGTPQVLLSADHPEVELPAGAHTHVSWAFTRPGVYRAQIRAHVTGTKTTLPPRTITFAVGVPADPNKRVLTSGHQDITADLTQGAITIQGDRPTRKNAGTAKTAHKNEAGAKGKSGEQNRSNGTQVSNTQYSQAPEDVVISVPSKTLQQVPADPQFRFIGAQNSEVYLLPQGVIGKHVHGELDPHLWHDAQNAILYAQTIADQLSNLDPDGAAQYARNLHALQTRLEQVDQKMRASIARIPPAKRNLVTTHDGYGYLSAAYGINIAGFITSSPTTQPSPRDLIALTRTLTNLKVNAVFLEPNASGSSNDLQRAAEQQGIRVCPIYGDSFTESVNSYEKMMTANAQNLLRCLGGHH